LTRSNYGEPSVYVSTMTVHHVVCVHYLPSGSLRLQMLGDDSIAEPDVVTSKEIMEATTSRTSRAHSSYSNR